MLKSHLFLRQQEQGTKSRARCMGSDHGSPTQHNAAPPLGCQHCCPQQGCQGSSYEKARKDFHQDHTLPSWKAFTVMLPGEVVWKHSQVNLSAPSPDLPSSTRLTTRAPTPACCQEGTSHHSCLSGQRPLKVTTALT